MTDQSDRQTSIYSSYKGENEFSFKFLVKDKKSYNYIRNRSRFKRIR